MSTRYLSVTDIIGLHQEIMARYKQPAVLKDNGEAALESAMMRPQMAAHYEDADLVRQVALLIIGIAQLHPFIDGNKRVAFAAGIVMLQLNGYLVRSKPQEFGRRIVAVLTASGSNEAMEEFIGWITDNLQPLSD